MWARYAACALFLVGLAQCSKAKTKSEEVTFSVLPDRPIVIDGDTVDSHGNKVKAPWFQFRLSVNNKSGSTVTVVAFQVTVYGQSSSGSTQSTPASFSSTDFNYTTDLLDCEYPSFGEFPTGKGDQALSLSNANTNCTAQPIFFVGNGTSGVSGSNFRYRVVVKPQGWFGTYADPSDRFEQTFTFYTQ
jgi:hypothetical protein